MSVSIAEIRVVHPRVGRGEGIYGCRERFAVRFENSVVDAFYFEVQADFRLSGWFQSNRGPRMPNKRKLRSWIFLICCGLILSPALHSSINQWLSVKRSELCVTEGTLEAAAGNELLVAVPKMRAYLNAVTPQLVEAHFTYLGSTGKEVPLGSGELRRQFGLKLRAHDPCNLVYAMWRIEPESKLVVSVKSNPGQHSSVECGNRGYRNIKPQHSVPVPLLRSGDAHTLRAEMNGPEMTVFADNKLVWEGSVGAEALAFDGPIGIRSDNAKLKIELRAGEPLRSPSRPAPGCRTGPGESE